MILFECNKNTKQSSIKRITGGVKMKAVVLHGPNDFATEEIKKPQIGDHEMLLKMTKERRNQD